MGLSAVRQVPLFMRVLYKLISVFGSTLLCSMSVTKLGRDKSDVFLKTYLSVMTCYFVHADILICLNKQV